MISPSQITIDVSGLPAAIQGAIASIDAAIQTWLPLENRKEISFAWAGVGGFTPLKAQALDSIIAGYRKRGWVCGIAPQSTLSVYVIFFELPT